MAQEMTLTLRIAADGRDAVNGLRVVSAEIDRTGRSARASQPQVSGLSAGFGALGASALRLAGVLGVGLGVAEMARSFVSANVEAQRLTASLTAIAGSGAKAGRELEYIRDVADRMGLLIGDVGNAWVSFAAATKGTAMEGQAARDVFESVSMAMGKLGKSSADTQGALLAMTQMITKDTVQAEEMTGQLGERLPGALKIAADGMGKTTAELLKMISEGKVAAVDILPKIGAGLKRLYDDGAAVGGLEAEWRRLKNALDTLSVGADDASGATGLMADALREVTGWVKQANEAVVKLGPDAQASIAELTTLFGGWGEIIAKIPANLAEIVAWLGNLPDYAVVIRDGTLALERQGTLWESFVELARAVGQAFLDLPDNLTAAIYIILGEIDVLKSNFQAGMDQLPLIAERAWAAIKYAIASSIAGIKVAVAEMVAYVAEKLASLAENMAGVMAQVPEALDIGGAAASAAASLAGLADSLKATKANVVLLKTEQSLLTAQYEAGNRALKGQQQAISDRSQAEVAGIRDLTSSLVAQVEANKVARQAQAELDGEFARAVAEEKRLEKQTGALTNATNQHARATKLSEEELKRLAKELQKAQGIVEGLVGKYLPLLAAEQRLRDARIALAKTGGVIETAFGKIKLSAEQEATIIQGLEQDFADLQRQQAETADRARRDADAFYDAWMQGVEGLDDAFLGLWKGLLGGQKDVLKDLKSYLLDWVSKLSYQLLLSPLIVPIQGMMTGMVGGYLPGVTTASGVASGASGMGGLSGLSSIGSWFTGNSMGTSLASGLSYVAGSTYGAMPNWFGSGMASLAMTPNWALGLGGIGGGLLGNALFGNKGYGSIGSTIGSTIGSAVGGASSAAISAALGIAIPGIGAIIGGLLGGLGGGWLGSLFGAKKPRIGSIAAQTGGTKNLLFDNWLEDTTSQGAFGLTFGFSNGGTKNVNAAKYKEVFDALAQISNGISQLFGKGLSDKVAKELEKMSEAGKGILYFTENESDIGAAMAGMVKAIADAAGRTGDDIGLVFQGVLGTLAGSAEEVAAQIESAMQTTVLAMTSAASLKGTDLARALGLTDALAADSLKLVSFANAIKTSEETTAQALQRMLVNLSAFEQAAILTGTRVGATGQAYVTLANQLAEAVKAAGGTLEGLAANQAAYYQTFWSEEERAARTRDQALKSIADWNTAAGRTGAAAIDTSAELRAYVESLNLNTQAGREAYVSAMGMVNAFIVLDQSLQAMQVTTTNLATVQAELTQRKADLEIEYLRLTRGEAAALAEERRRELAAMDASIRPMQQQIYAIEDQIAAYDRLAQQQEALARRREQAAQSQADAEIALIRARSGDAAALAEARRRELVAADRSLQPILKRIWAIEDETAALERQAKAADERKGLNIRLAEAQGNDRLATRLRRELELAAAADDANRALLRQIYALEDQAKAAALAAQAQQERAGLSIRLAEAQGNDSLATRLRRELELAAATDDANRALLRQIYALEDQAKAAALAAQAQQERAGLAIRLAEAQGNDSLATRLRREQELAAAADNANRALLRQIYALEDQAQAAAQAAQAQQERAGLSIRLAEAQGNEPLATRLRREQELAAAADNANRALLRQIYALEDQAQAAALASQAQQERAGLSIRLAEAQGNDSLATRLRREQELAAAADNANRALLRQIYALEDQAQAAALAAQAQQERAGLSIRLAEAQGNDSLAIRLRREQELAAAADDANRALLRQIYAAEDAASAAELINAKLQELGASLRQVSDAIGATIARISDLIQAPVALQAQRRREAQAQIGAALAAARAGNVPSAASLERPLATLSENPAALFADRVAYLRDLGRTRAQLQQLQALVEASIPRADASVQLLENLPAALAPNFEAIVAALSANATDNRASLASATAPIADALQALFARTEAGNQAINKLDQDLVAWRAEFQAFASKQFAPVAADLATLARQSTLVQSGLGEQGAAFQAFASKQFAAAAADLATLARQAALAYQALTGQVAAFQAFVSKNFIPAADHFAILSRYAVLSYQSLGEQRAELRGVNSQLGPVSGYLDYLARNAKTSGWHGFATGGISDGPLSGYGVTLHGTEAVIPLGDGNRVNAYLNAPLPPAPNLIRAEAGDNLALRQALAELQAELRALRGDAQMASAATVGELKDHNRRERRRDAIGQKVEVVSP